jgi:hypothetical protein
MLKPDVGVTCPTRTTWYHFRNSAATTTAAPSALRALPTGVPGRTARAYRNGSENARAVRLR